MLTIVFAVSACSLIDEDLSNCGFEVTVEYTLVVSPQPPEELASKMVTPEEVRLGDVVRRQYETFFDPYSDSLEVSLCCGDLPVVYRNCVYGSCCTKTYFLSKGIYTHEAYANGFEADTTLIVEDRAVSQWLYMRHTQGVVALVFDGIASEVNSVQVVMAGIDVEELPNTTSLSCYSMKMYPRQGLWQTDVIVSLNNGTKTKTSLKVQRPIIAGDLLIEKAYIDSTGAVCALTDEMSATVTFDWKDGSAYTPDI